MARIVRRWLACIRWIMDGIFYVMCHMAEAGMEYDVVVLSSLSYFLSSCGVLICVLTG